MFIRILTTLFMTALLIMQVGCERDIDMLEPASYPSFSEVFLDEFVAGLDYSAFGNSKLDAFEIGNDEAYKGSHSIKITVPGVNDPAGWYAGGSFYSTFPRDLSGYNALTFWGKASKTSLAEIGFGNDNSGNSLYSASQPKILFGTSWQKYVIPIPAPEKLKTETGMFWYSAGADEQGLGTTLWFDEVKYEKLGTIAYPRIILEDTLLTAPIGGLLDPGINGVTYNIDGVDQTVNAAKAYFTVSSLNESVATIAADGKIQAIAEGTTEILVKLGSVTQEKITLTVGAEFGPSIAAPMPTVPADSVISLFSNAYTNHPAIVWNTFWQFSNAKTEDILVAGDDVKVYTDLNFVGIEFTSPTVNASGMTHFHMDIWTPEPTDAGQAFKVQLVDFGADGAFGGGDDSSHELSFSSSTVPALATQEWISLDIPLSDFSELISTGHLAQMVLSGDLPTVFVDNVYFYDKGGSGPTPTEPTTPAPTPSYAAGDVISLFSNTYTDVAVDTWSATWDNANVADLQVAGDDVKKYTDLVFAGIEFTSQTIDASAMTHFSIDFWTPDPTEAPVVFKIKLVDFGAGGTFGGGDDAEHELILNDTTIPAIATGNWVSLDIPLSDFTGLTTKGHLAQLIISGDPNTVFIDNVIFHK